METLTDLMVKHGLRPIMGRGSSPKQRLLSQAHSMLKKIEGYKSSEDLNSETSNQNWWGGSSVGGMRRVMARYDNKVVPQLVTEVEDDLTKVKATITALVAIIKDSTDEHWAAEEARRKVESEKRPKKAGSVKKKA